ncbi:MAG: hypothetical protein GX663_09910 [Clostridiales bacterium]|nr:hypothetical protein [Clostridiales bacterium]
MGMIITFFGCMGDVGTSMIATSCAQDLAGLRQRVLLIYASSHVGDDYVEDDTRVSIDDLRRSDSISAEAVRAIIVKDTCKFHYIKTVREITQIKYFDPGVITNIVRAVGKEYDFILVDGGCDIQYPLTASALMAADKRFFIVTGTMKALRRFCSVRDVLFIPKGMYEDSHIIINRYDKKQDAVASSQQIQQRFGLPCVEVPSVKGGARAETDGRTLLGKGCYNQAIRNITIEIRGRRG